MHATSTEMLPTVSNPIGGNPGQAVDTRGTLGRVNASRPADPGDSDRRTLEERLRDPGFRAKYERVYAEMRGELAPAIEGPVVNPGRKRRGRLVFGDDVDERR